MDAGTAGVASYCFGLSLPHQGSRFRDGARGGLDVFLCREQAGEVAQGDPVAAMGAGFIRRVDAHVREERLNRVGRSPRPRPAPGEPRRSRPGPGTRRSGVRRRRKRAGGRGLPMNLVDRRAELHEALTSGEWDSRSSSLRGSWSVSASGRTRRLSTYPGGLHSRLPGC